MIETQADARRFASIDGATTVGEMADRVVTATLHWQAIRRLAPADQEALRAAITWLERASEVLERPLLMARTGGTTSALPGLDSFGSDLAGAALKVIEREDSPQSGSAALRHLRDGVSALVEGRASTQDAERVQHVFEAIAQLMLSSVDAMLAPAIRTSWTTTSGS